MSNDQASRGDRPTRFPRFRFGEVVRVLGVSDLQAGDPDPRGAEGEVSSFAPRADGRAWDVGVWLPDLEEVWSFAETELESEGLVVIDRRGDERAMLDPATHEASFPAELSLRLVTKIEAEQAESVANSAERVLRTLVPFEELTWAGEVHWQDPPYRYDVTLAVRTQEHPREAFEAIVSSRATGWTYLVDDGWSCQFWWSAGQDETGEPFLAPEARHVGVFLEPWSDPSSRPVKAGRTHDPGLPGYTPRSPAAGYEA